MPEQEHHISQQELLPSPSFASSRSGGSSIATSFDELAKELATGTLSRGKALRLVGGALIGAALASVPGVALADDDCRRLGRECRRDSQCCSRNCIRRGDDKVCGCPSGQSRCGDRCVNLKTNERHCGSCSERCATNQTCCNGNCVNLQRNENNCGRCGNRCPEESECVRGECQGSCPPERTLTEGECRCAFVCGDPFPSPATCQDNPNCLCSETTEGTASALAPALGVVLQSAPQAVIASRVRSA